MARDVIRLVGIDCDCERDCDCWRCPSGAILINGKGGNGSYDTVVDNDGKVSISFTFMGVTREVQSLEQVRSCLRVMLSDFSDVGVC